MHSEWKEIIEREMEREAERIMEEVNSDPALKDVKAPPDIYDGLMEKIREYEKQKVYNQLSEEDREYLRVGKAYMKRRRLNRYIVLVAAIVALFALGSVSIGEDKNIFHVISRMLSAGERTAVNSEDAEPISYVDEHELYEDIEKTYGFVPVKLGYLPEDTEFCEAALSKAIQCINIIYETRDKTSLVYVIRPNYREGSFGTDVEDKKTQEYQMTVEGINIMITEYTIPETRENQWTICFVYEDVTYLLRVSDIEQAQVEKIVTNLIFTQQ